MTTTAPIRSLAFLLASTTFLFPVAALAEEVGASSESANQPAPAQPVSPPPPSHGTEQHDHEENAIVVTAHFVRDLDLLAGTSVLSGGALQREIRPQLGETLARLPGVSATSFTPGASRPVLRGFQGERIRVLTDGIGSIDVSNTSADHAVTIDPLTAERVEVLRGPAVLLFGGQAIGGAVNVIDRRIPRAVPKNGVHVDLLGVLGSAADERSIGGAVDAALADSGFVFHLSGSARKTDDLEVGGYLLAPNLRAEQLDIAAEEAAEGHADEAEEALELANARGRVPNSGTSQKTLSTGFAYIKGPLSLGLAVSLFDSDYGVPMRPGAEHAHGEEGELPGEHAEEEHGEEVSIGLDQVRVDLRGEYELASGFIDRVRLRIGAADYEHTEFEGDEVGTVFESRGAEGRIEFVQRDRDGWRGASGAQYFTRDFKAVGAEAFLPANETSQWGLFTFQEIAIGDLALEGAIRLERTNVRSDVVGVERNFTAVSVATGANYELFPGAKVGLNLSRTTRAPSAEELFSNGPHIATQAFEIGDPGLGKEKSLGAEAYVRVDRGRWSLSATAFINRFNDFIFESATGEEQDELPVFRYFQRDATWKGFELEGSARLFEAGDVRFVADVVADYVRATIKGSGPAPRIPPLRLLGGLEAQSDRLNGRVEVEWVDEQDRIADFETSTDGFTLVNASLSWRPLGRGNETVVVLSANNIFDVDARRHASFTKDFVPLAGRDIRLSTRLSF